MLALPSHGFVMLSMPKCASTSLVRSIAGQAEVVLRVNPKLKHINCAQFHELMVPLLRKGGYQRKDYELVSLMREPVEWLESWWRYRRRPALEEERATRFTGDQTFEEFTRAYLGRRSTVRGRPARFLSMSDDLDVGVDRIFALEQPEVWQGWIAEKTGNVADISTANRSTERAEPELSAALREELVAYFAPEYDLYRHVRDAGTWTPPPGYVAGSGA